MLKNHKIVVTGGNGRFAKSLKKIKCKYKFVYPEKSNRDITDLKSINKYLNDHGWAILTKES